MDIDLQKLRTKYIKMNKNARKSAEGLRVFKILHGTKPMDSAGNSENQSSSEDIKRKKNVWKTQTSECDVCGKEMLKSRMEKHMKLAHKSKRIYPCDECKFNAENLMELKLHLRKTHKLSSETVTKMLRLMKTNRKYRRSVLAEDEDEEEPTEKPKKLFGSLGSVKSLIKDELHQTDSDMEKRPRRPAVCYKEPSFDLDDDEEYQMRATLTYISKEVEPLYSELGETPSVSTAAEALKDSGRESQLSQASTESNETFDKTDFVAAKELLDNMPTLEADDLPKEGVRNHSDKQLKHLLSFFEVCQTPSL